MSEELSTTIVSPEEATELRASQNSQPAWVRWVLPSISDIFFLVFLGILAFGSASAAFLGDADTGWHIRNGETILATHVVPHTDPFSYTKAGEPWYAWEWLYDAGIGAIHHVSGLNGVVLFSAAVIALTFSLLFRLVLRRSGNFAAAAFLTVLAAAASQVHILARPHILSWLMTLLWIDVLYRFGEGKRTALIWLPPLMLLWVNVHGGFILGIVLLGIFCCGRIWDFFRAAALTDRSLIKSDLLALAGVTTACLAATFATPYSYKLHVHVYEYLSNRYLMDHISEFTSPNFHGGGFGYFEAFILLMIVGAVFGRNRIAVTDLLLILFATHSSLYAARNIPISAILMSTAIAPSLAQAISPRPDYPGWLRPVFVYIDEISSNMSSLEKQFRGHLAAVLLLVFSIAVVLNGGRLWSKQIFSAHFDPKNFPVRAADFIASRGIHDHMFNNDGWSGYLIYRLYPGTKLYFDDRHDFYGEAFVQEFSKTFNAEWDWEKSFGKYHVRWALLPISSPLSTILKQRTDWRVEYDDGVAILFSRRN